MTAIKLNVPYYLQWDSATWQGSRMCFSSTCAMLLEYLIPTALKGGGQQEDDEYLARVNTRGDTTLAHIQVATLKSFGLTSAEFRPDLDWVDIDRQLERGIPVPVGWLIRGHVSAPSGGGHWSLIVGRTSNGNYLFHDPNGECDLINGGYVDYNGGKFVEYSKANFDKRWRVNGAPGWGILCDAAQPPSKPSKAPETPVIKVTPIKAKIHGLDHDAFIIENRAYVPAAPFGANWDPETRVVKIND